MGALSPDTENRLSDDTVLSQKRLLIIGHPPEDLRFPVQLLDEVVNIEIYRRVRLVLASVGRRPGDMGHAMQFVYW